MNPSIPEQPKPGFKVPENYFETLDERVLTALRSETGKKPVPPRMRISSATWSIAASLILGGFAILLFRPGTESKINLSYGLQHIDSAELAEYTGSLELDEEEFEAFLPEQVVDSIYNAQIAEASAYDEDLLQDIESEYSILDEDNDI
jgi:hypothetical protein